jgi:amidase
VPRGDGLPAFDTLWVDGPMARNVSDLALMLDAMTGLTAHDPLSRPIPAGGYQAAMAARRPPRRIGFSPDLGLRRIDPDVAKICRTASQQLADLETVVEEVIPDFTGGIECFQVLRALLFADVRGELLPAERHRINPDIVWNIEKGLGLAAADILPAMRVRHRIYHNVAQFFDRYDLLVCPTVAVPPFPVEQRFPTEIAGEKLTTYIDWMFLTFVLTLTSCPVISIPCGVTTTGLPIGLQLVGRPHGDSELLGFARLAEQALQFSPLIMKV